MTLNATAIKSLMTSSQTLFGPKSSATKGAIGVEIENEFLEPVELPIVKNWRVTADGSLRYYGYEFVSAPLVYNDVLRSVDELSLAIAEIRHKPTDSIRTSTHVHFDMRDVSAIDVIKFALTYWILEELLSDFAGRGRKGNLFCLRLKDAEVVANFVIEALQGVHIKDNALFSENFRYGSVNFAALKKFGTLEFRLMRGTFNKTLLKTWITALYNIKKFSESFKTIDALREAFMRLPAEDFAKQALGVSYKDIAVCAERPVQDLVREGFKYTENILYCMESFDLHFLVEEAKRKRLEKEKKFSRTVIEGSSLPFDQADDEILFGDLELTEEEI